MIVRISPAASPRVVLPATVNVPVVAKLPAVTVFVTASVPTFAIPAVVKLPPVILPTTVAAPITASVPTFAIPAVVKLPPVTFATALIFPLTYSSPVTSSALPGALVFTPTRLLVASMKNVLLSKFRLLGILTELPLIVRISPAASPNVVLPLTTTLVIVTVLGTTRLPTLVR